MEQTKTQSIVLSTFPRNDRFFSRVFSVPMNWLLEQLEDLDVDLEYFLDGYVWEDSLPIFCEARKQRKILWLEEK